MSKFFIVLLSGMLFIAPLSARAFDSDAIRSKIEEAGRAAFPTVGAATMDFGAVRADRLKRLKDEQDAAFTLHSTCDARFNALRHTLKKQVSRSEWISIGGGLIGILGTVATCPHCAAFAAGMAGLANPMQQTFKDNYDSPQDTQNTLQKLSEITTRELEAYEQLPAADIEDVSTFEPRLRKRLDALLLVTATCSYYSKTLEAAK